MAIKYLTQNQVQVLINSISDIRDKAIIALIYSYGLRRTELCNLKISDVDFNNHRIYIQALKNGISGNHYLTDSCIALIKEYLIFRNTLTMELPYLFLAKYKHFTRLDGGSVGRIFLKYAKQIGLPPEFSVHSLRHSLATALLSSGRDLGLVKDLLRHRSVQSTVVYANIMDEKKLKMQKEALESAEFIAKF